ncbi:phospholipase D-like domain-containing protein [Faecalicoccus pleomorphus]|uniref:phospholipase D-like domain-containing protein n=1 Tax=Faecalicoccus pleomorphus TaxID=1323 RepID=UPI0018987801|nr:phospholipase D-like domain-containing protein [Faecalicoccus pleomorphus]MDB7984354.1 phospholipase D-like domain-containing protein [Faecalicoccus pleomorphus]
MVRNAFLKTMIDVLKYNNLYEINGKNREHLIRLLGRARVNFVPQYAFTNHGRSYQHWEIVELSFPVPLLDAAIKYQSDLDSLVNYVYEETDEYALHHMEIKPQVIDAPEEVTEHNVVFNKIQDTIIQGIRDAKFIIWAAVAWFSNDAIYQELIVKKEQGLSIRIIVSEEESNKKMIAKLKDNGFNVKVIPKWGVLGHNRMHDKFCIIDMDYVMHGSYNWTSTANYNKETLATASDHEFVSKFAKEFMTLYNTNN